MSSEMIVGNSREEWPVQSDSVDMVVTSPPYNVELDYDHYSDDLSVSEYLDVIEDVFTHARNCIKSGGRLAVNVPNGIGRSPVYPIHHDVDETIRSLGFELRGIVAWSKGGVTASSWGSWQSPSNPCLRRMHEHIYIYSLDGFRHDGGDESESTLTKQDFLQSTESVWEITPDQSDYDHPGVMPVELAERLVNLLTWSDDIVLDPFAGIGTTGVACENLGRDFVGIELSEDYARTARARIEAEGGD